jgi:tRNA(adenine34) deaminase
MTSRPNPEAMPTGPTSETDLRWMRVAYDEAVMAAEQGEVPVGAVVVAGGRPIGRGQNRIESLQDPTAHAEILAITAAANTEGSWRLEGATLYVTLEPCLMCAGAIFLARIERLVFAARDPKRGALGSVIDVSQNEALNHHTEIEQGPLVDACGRLLTVFFEKLRKDPGTA